MTDQPFAADASHGDPTAPTPPPPAPAPEAATPALDAPPAPSAYQAPPAAEAVAPPTYDAPTYGAPSAYPPPAANPYGGYGQAPPPSAQGGYVAVGSLPYVEHHFGPVAQFGDRILPSIVDGLLGLVGVIPMIIGMFIIGASSGSGSYDADGNYVSTASGAGVGIGVLFLFLGMALAIAIQVWNRFFKQGRTGQSVGKKMFGLKLVNATSGQPIGAGMAFVRDIINSLANQVVMLGYLWMLWDPNRQTLGDMVAKSTVIKVAKS